MNFKRIALETILGISMAMGISNGNASVRKAAFPLIVENASAAPIMNEEKRMKAIATPIYDDKYKQIDGNEDNIAKKLFPYNLQQLVDSRMITSEIYDIALPLGISGNIRDVNFVRGMENMWNAKLGIKRDRKLRAKRDHFVKLMKEGSERYSLRAYRQNEVAEGMRVKNEIYENLISEKFDGEMKSLLEVIEKDFTPNVFIAYNIQELLPVAEHGKSINPIFKAFILDRFFKEGGKVLLEGYPARYDRKMSYGPFQMTDIAMPQVSKMNRYVSENHKVHEKVEKFDGLQEHVNSAVMFAMSNWINLGNYLNRKGLLKTFSQGMESMDDREREILVAGITACMHHQPTKTQKRVAYYVSNAKKGKRKMGSMYHGIKSSLNPALISYYDSAAKAFLFMKQFHRYEGKYSGK